MKTYMKDKFEDSDIREALAEKFHYPIEDIRRDGYGFAVTHEVKEQEETYLIGREVLIFPLSRLTLLS